MNNTKTYGLISGILLLIQVVAFTLVFQISRAISVYGFESFGEFVKMYWMSLVSAIIIIVFSISLIVDSVTLGLITRIIAAVFSLSTSSLSIIRMLSSRSSMMISNLTVLVISILISVLVVLAYILQGQSAKVLCIISAALCTISPIMYIMRGTMLNWQYLLSTLLLIIAYVFLGLYLGGKSRIKKAIIYDGLPQVDPFSNEQKLANFQKLYDMGMISRMEFEAKREELTR